MKYALRISFEKDCAPQIALGRKCDFHEKSDLLREKCFPRHGKAAPGKRIRFHLRRARRKLCDSPRAACGGCPLHGSCGRTCEAF